MGSIFKFPEPWTAISLPRSVEDLRPSKGTMNGRALCRATVLTLGEDVTSPTLRTNYQACTDFQIVFFDGVQQSLGEGLILLEEAAVICLEEA